MKQNNPTNAEVASDISCCILYHCSLASQISTVHWCFKPRNEPGCTALMASCLIMFISYLVLQSMRELHWSLLRNQAEPAEPQLTRPGAAPLTLRAKPVQPSELWVPQILYSFKMTVPYINCKSRCEVLSYNLKAYYCNLVNRGD